MMNIPVNGKSALAPRQAVFARHTGNVALGVILLMFVSQLLLLVPFFSSFRIVFRTATFGVSILALMFLAPALRPAHHPARSLGIVAMAILGFAFFNPGTDFIPGVASWFLNLAIMAPLFWTSRLAMSPVYFRRMLLVLFAFHTLSSIFGVLQVHYPGRFQPALSTIIRTRAEYAESLKITLADGSSVFRPMGLTDSPGGASLSGFYACLFGTCLLLSEKGWLRAASLGAIAAGLFCIYLAQVRVMLILLVIDWIAFIGLLIRNGRANLALRFGLLLAFMVPVVFAYSLAVGGDVVSRRLESLTEQGALEVYQTNRGKYLEYTLYVLLPNYPLGTGMGRWGMMNGYFSSSPSSALFAEIQWTGWLYDGGILLMLSYGAAILVVIWTNYTGAMRAMATHLQMWNALGFAYSVGTFAATFSYVPFIGQMGLEFWLINGSLYQVNVAAKRAMARQAALAANAKRPPPATQADSERTAPSRGADTPEAAVKTIDCSMIEPRTDGVRRGEQELHINLNNEF